MLYTLVTFRTIEKGEQSMEAAGMGQFHFDLREASKVCGAKMTTPMKTKGPLSKVSFADGHPNAINVAEETDGPEARFGSGPGLGDQGDDGGADRLGPCAQGLPVIVALC